MNHRGISTTEDTEHTENGAVVVVCIVRLLRPPHAAWAFLTRGTKLVWGCEVDLLRLTRAVFWGCWSASVSRAKAEATVSVLGVRNDAGEKVVWGCEADLLRLKRAAFWGGGGVSFPG